MFCGASCTASNAPEISHSTAQENISHAQDGHVSDFRVSSQVPHQSINDRQVVNPSSIGFEKVAKFFGKSFAVLEAIVAVNEFPKARAVRIAMNAAQKAASTATPNPIYDAVLSFVPELSCVIVLCASVAAFVYLSKEQPQKRHHHHSHHVEPAHQPTRATREGWVRLGDIMTDEERMAERRRIQAELARLQLQDAQAPRAPSATPSDITDYTGPNTPYTFNLHGSFTIGVKRQ